MGDFPITLKVQGRRCLVVGGGQVAARKARALADSGAHVVVVAPRTESEIAADEIHRRPFEPSDLDGAMLAVAATNAPEVNAAVEAEATTRGVLVSVANDRERGDYQSPALLRRGALTVSVSTGGASPALARRLRDNLEEHVGGELGELCNLLDEFRSRVHENVADPIRRREILRAAGDPELAVLIKEEGHDAVRLRLARMLDE